MKPINWISLVGVVCISALLVPGQWLKASGFEVSGNWGGFTYTPLPIPGVPWVANNPAGVSINNGDDIIISGDYQVPLPGGGFTTSSKGFLRRSDGTLVEISFPVTLGSSAPASINDLGQIAGRMSGTWKDENGFEVRGQGVFVRETNGTYRAVYVNPFGAVRDSSISINNNGQISFSTNGDIPCTFFGRIVEPNGAPAFVSFPNDCDTFLTGLNDRGIGVGYATPLPGNPTEVAFFWQSGQFNVFAQSPPFLITGDINNFNQIILNAAIFDPDGRTIPLAFPGATTTGAIAINDRGHVVGFYSDSSGGGAFLAIPQGTLTLTPAAATNITDSVHTMTATALDSLGLPVPGVTVHFFVNAGPNSGRIANIVTDQFGQAIFTYPGTGGVGKDEIFAIADNVNSNLAFKNWQVPPENVPPSCSLSSILSGPPKEIQVTAQDAGSGLKSIVATTASNFTISIPAFAQGTTAPVVVTATKVNPANPAILTLQVTDVANNVTNCDSFFETLRREVGKPDPVSLTVPRNDHLLNISNGTPGIGVIKVLVNGQLFQVLDGLKDGEVRVIDLASAMKPGANVITLEANGKPNGTADIVIHN